MKIDFSSKIKNILSSARIYILTIILVLCIGLAFCLWKGKIAMERYGEQWVRGYLKTEVDLDIGWDGWRWDAFYSRLNINGIKVSGGDTFGAELWLYIDRLELYYNPLRLIIKDPRILG